MEESKQLTLGEIINKLCKLLHKPDATVMYDFGCFFYPYQVGSWRGSYNEFSIGYNQHNPITISQFHELLSESINAYFEGYKGGEYQMTENTRVWVANYSDSGHTGITDVIDAGNYIILATGYFEY